MTKQTYTKKIIAQLRAKGLLNEKAVKKYIARKTLNEAAECTTDFGKFVFASGNGKTGSGKFTLNQNLIIHGRKLSFKEIIEWVETDGYNELDNELLKGIQKYYQLDENDVEDLIITGRELDRFNNIEFEYT